MKDLKKEDFNINKMKKILFLLISLLLFSCKENNESENIQVNYVVEVDYLDGIRDTITIITKDTTSTPRLSINNSVSCIDLGWYSKVCYVKTFRVLSREYILLK